MNTLKILSSYILLYLLLLPSWGSDQNIYMGDISIHPAKPFFIYGEPVVMNVVISNGHPDEVTAYTELQNGIGATYELSSDNKIYSIIASGFHRDPVGKTQILNPGEVISHDEVLLYNWRQRTPLFQIGTNYVRVTYYGNKSTPVPVIIIPPSNEEDVLSSQIMSSPEVMKAIALKNISEVRSELNTVAKQGSCLSPYAALFLVTYEESYMPEDVDDLLNIADKSGFPLRSQVIKIKDSRKSTE